MTNFEPHELIAASIIKPFSKFPVTVLLVDDQEIVAETVRRMLAEEEDIHFYYCSDPIKALEKATEVMPTVILQDLVMPDIGGIELVRYFRADEKTRDIPLIVLSTKEDPKIKAEAFSVGANDYIVKLPDKIELLARIRYHSYGYIRLLERNEAYEKLQESQRHLIEELSEAAQYVRTLLPHPIDERLSTEWQFIPSAQLGGDALGYFWINSKEFVIYLLDVCGHGVGAALLSIAIINVLKSQTLPNANFQNPSSVLSTLNEAFPMEKHYNMFFTIWYGVYNIEKRILTYSSGGHPPAFLIDEKGENYLLKTDGVVIGAGIGDEFVNASIKIPPNSKLYIFSDGTYEIMKKEGNMMQLEELIGIIKEVQRSDNPLEAIFNKVKLINGNKPFVDDYTFLEVALP